MARIIVPEFLGERFLDSLQTEHEVEYDPDLYGDRDRLLTAVANARAILIRNRTKVDQEFSMLPRL